MRTLPPILKTSCTADAALLLRGGKGAVLLYAQADQMCTVLYKQADLISRGQLVLESCIPRVLYMQLT